MMPPGGEESGSSEAAVEPPRGGAVPVSSPPAGGGSGGPSFWERHPLLARFDLSADQADVAVIDHGLRAGVVFRGTNLWLLIFAIVIASVGLNVNSTAVIIGAMLVSPLMGPIMGVGYGAGVADFQLVRTSLLNLALATAVSLAASALYFVLTPLSAAHSELLARTSPTMWDLLIALFGGLAGIVGATRRERSNVVPGVAIATALMPPLCTAGYGLATATPAYFFGAFYLFLLNSVFIAAATFLMTRVLGLPEVALPDPAAARRAHRWMAVVVAATALPSVVLAQRLVAAELYHRDVDTFVTAAFPTDGPSIVVARDVDPARRVIRLTLVGAPLGEERRAALEAMLPAARLGGSSLVLREGTAQEVDIASLRQDLGEELHQRTIAELAARDATIDTLRAEVAATEEARALATAVEAEVRAQHPELGRVLLGSRSGEGGTTVVLLVERDAPLEPEARDTLARWLRVRTGAGEALVVPLPPARPPEPPPDRR